MNNSIAERIATFLKDYLPFNYLEFKDLVEISTSVRVLNLEKDASLFQINDNLHDCFYIMNSGVVHLSVISDSQETLLNKCYTGDIFGLRPFFAKNNYQMSAKAREESIIYAIPIEDFKPYLAKNTEILNFLLESFATNTKSSLDKENTNKIISDNMMYSENQSDTSFLQSLSYNKNPLLVDKLTSIKNVAIIMSDNLQGNAIIIENNFPIGIVTDSDFRSKIATGKFDISASIEKIMNTPVLTVSENVSVAEAQLVILKNGISHLCVTQDGTEKSEVKGIISEHDLIEAQANNPGVLLKEIKRSQTPLELLKIRESLSEIVQTSISKNIPINHINTITGEITIAIIKRAVELAILEMGSPPVSFTFLSIGSQGRKEQLLTTDHDNILIFEDVATDKYRDVKDYFLKLAKNVSNTIEQTGYKHCVFGHTASNTHWCKSLTDWTKQYNTWINTPGENSSDHCSIFFDYELTFGDQKIENAITENIFKNAKENILFFDYLGNEALKAPTPLNFFKKFNVEEDGIYKGKFDIKTKAIMPLVDSARLLILNYEIKGINNTYLRFKQLSIIDSANAETYIDCAEAFLTLTKFRTMEGLKNDSDGQFINLEELNKLDKEKLKSSLSPLKDLEEIIKDTFQLTQFS